MNLLVYQPFLMQHCSNTSVHHYYLQTTNTMCRYSYVFIFPSAYVFFLLGVPGIYNNGREFDRHKSTVFIHIALYSDEFSYKHANLSTLLYRGRNFKVLFTDRLF